MRISTDDLQLLRQAALDVDMARLRFGDAQEYVTSKYGISAPRHILDFITGEIRTNEQPSSNGATTDIEELKNTVKETPWKETHMPEVGGKKYPYTAAGRAAAKREAERTGKPVMNSWKKKTATTPKKRQTKRY